MAFAFKLQDNIDDMFEQTWAGDRSIFSYMADQEQSDIAIFTDTD